MKQDVFTRYVPLIDAEMRRVLALDDPMLAGHYGMLRYHMGWVDEGFAAAQVNSGKRIRPVLCLLACQSVGGTVAEALPAAAALELLHNFSLIHDDIQDHSPTRRHRSTVWALWGPAQAINAGDAMFTLARMALYGLRSCDISADRILEALELFDTTCLRLTEGQYLDMSFEDRLDVSVEEYLAMIDGKTAALVHASLSLGALVGGAQPEVQRHLGRFGRGVGMAFQIQDDLLGIWGDEALTGKSAESDILTRKKSLPVVVGLQHPRVGPQLRSLYAAPIEPDQVPQVLALLEEAGARSYAGAEAQRVHQEAQAALEASGVLAGDNAAGHALLDVAEALLGRQH
jgi:geranylgeranyl diphosphate synthase type I